MNNVQILSYGVGDFGINLYSMSAITFLLFFYTDVYGLSAAVAGGVFLVARIVDAVTDPIMGFIADGTHSRWGKFRPYVFYGPVPLGLTAVAMFAVPGFGDFGKAGGIRAAGRVRLRRQRSAVRGVARGDPVDDVPGSAHPCRSPFRLPIAWTSMRMGVSWPN